MVAEPEGGQELGPELNVVGIYEPGSDSEDATFNVQLDRPGESILVLSAYRRTHWNVAVAEGATIRQIIANGYHAPTVTAPPGVPIETVSYEAQREFWGASNSLPLETEFQTEIEARAGRGISFFAGCYSMTHITIGTAAE